MVHLDITGPPRGVLAINFSVSFSLLLTYHAPFSARSLIPVECVPWMPRQNGVVHETPVLVFFLSPLFNCSATSVFV